MNRSWGEYLTTILLAILLAMGVRYFILTAYKVPTGSMQPSLRPGDFIFSWRLAYRDLGGSFFSDATGEVPKRGDLIVFTYPNQANISYLKRVVGIPGDKIEIKEGRLWLNDNLSKYTVPTQNYENPNSNLFEILVEDDGYTSHPVILELNGKQKNFGPLVVPPGEVFVLGDNRDASDDSRYWGTVPVNLIQGRVVLIWLSLEASKTGGLNKLPHVRWERIFTRPH